MSFHFLWHLLYDKLSFLFDFVCERVSGGRWKQWGRTSISFLKGHKVLELGHGPGYLLIELKRTGHQPFGIDLSRGMGRMTSRRLRRTGINLPIVRCRAQALPFRANSFDSAVATFPTDDVLKLGSLQEVARVIPQGGRFAMVVGAQREGTQPAPFFIEWLKGFIGQDGDEKNSAKAIFPRAGFRSRIECRSVDGSPVILLIAEKWQRHDGWVNMLPSVHVTQVIKLLSKDYRNEVIEGRAKDADGDPLTYRWLREQTILVDWREVGQDGRLSLEFHDIPPLEIGSHALTLEVADPYETVRNTILITIENSPPVIMPMGEKICEAGRPVVVATRIWDYDGDALNYCWLEEETVLATGRVRTQKGGNPVPLTTAISDLSPGEHVVKLEVSDGVNPPVWDSTTVRVLDISSAQMM